MDSNIDIKDNARLSEIITASICSKIVFKEKVLIVGDSAKQADIVASDNSIAIEVVSCEIPLSGIQSCYYYGICDIRKMFYDNIKKKLEKLKNGNYDNSPQAIYLAIDSMREMANLIEVEEGMQIYNAIIKDYKRAFAGLIMLNKFGITLNGKFSLYDFDFRQYIIDLEVCFLRGRKLTEKQHKEFELYGNK